ncbi:reverse transcriptase domain-containing protein [Gluconobacter morbifer]|uniref:reverse transcriptase domain-containing protein n=1 Tax=Gluconobacter morbifer TaxID=479935 RepID=UPI000A00BD6F
MSVIIPNFKYSYRHKNKPIFVPTKIGRRIGDEIKSKVEKHYEFPPIYFHLQRGGHVAAMHHHRNSHIFARIDIARFFYSISRRRVQSALDKISVNNARFYAKWSTVSNPYKSPKFVLPYGFVQSPILASLVMSTSEIGDLLLSLTNLVNASVYMDDILLSSKDPSELYKAFNLVQDALVADGFLLSSEYQRLPSTYLIAILNTGAQ